MGKPTRTFTEDFSCIFFVMGQRSLKAKKEIDTEIHVGPTVYLASLEQKKFFRKTFENHRR